ncbi:hypothetical protein ACMD2_01399 [Ananas comosus]|uniref:Uncharacterized protein n=1 Tax=Ananas comosus TaxID=4615 RepID=A0A199VGB6_ANACO|nr:hypothetical protein ACMD2_01399 [Ananas comosus]
MATAAIGAHLLPLFPRPSRVLFGHRSFAATPIPAHRASPLTQLRRSWPSKSNPSSRFSPVVASQSNFFRAWRVSKDVIEAGTSFVPAAVPRPVARVSVAVVAVTVALFLLKSFLSTAFFVLAMMALIYFVFVAFNTDEVSGGSGGSESTTSTEETLEEARRIMEKYK